MHLDSGVAGACGAIRRILVEIKDENPVYLRLTFAKQSLKASGPILFTRLFYCIYSSYFSVIPNFVYYLQHDRQGVPQ